MFDAQYFGTAQRRKRVFIVGHSRKGHAASVLLDANAQFLETAQERLVFPTLTANGQVDNGGGSWTKGYAIVDTRGIRTLTPVECERLQGFPDDWTRLDDKDKVLSDTARYRLCGNAVAVPCAEWIGKRIMQHAD